jgi:hypothetical protein
MTAASCCIVQEIPSPSVKLTDPWRWEWDVVPKCWQLTTNQYCITSQKSEDLVITYCLHGRFLWEQKKLTINVRRDAGMVHRDFSVFFSGVVLMSSVTKAGSAIEKWMSMKHCWNYTDRKNLRTQRKTCPSVTLPTTNPTMTGLGLNLGFQRPATNCLSHSKASI